MKINDKEYKLAYTGETLIIYKETFKKDLILESQKIRKDFDFVTLLEICWSMIRTCQDDVPEFREFMASINITKFLSDTSVIKEMLKALDSDGSPTKEIKKK